MKRRDRILRRRIGQDRDSESSPVRSGPSCYSYTPTVTWRTTGRPPARSRSPGRSGHRLGAAAFHSTHIGGQSALALQADGLAAQSLRGVAASCALPRHAAPFSSLQLRDQLPRSAASGGLDSLHLASRVSLAHQRARRADGRDAVLWPRSFSGMRLRPAGLCRAIGRPRPVRLGLLLGQLRPAGLGRGWRCPALADWSWAMLGRWWRPAPSRPWPMLGRLWRPAASRPRSMLRQGHL